MLKKIIGVMIVLFLFTGCVNYSDGDPADLEPTMVALHEDPLTFGEFTILINFIGIYGDSTNYADVSFTWTNQAGDGVKKFISMSQMDVYQGEKMLDEKTNAFDVNNQDMSMIFFDNSENEEVNVILTYELKSTEELRIVFTPLNELAEDPQEVEFDIKKN
ncbi:hypothetical protein ACTHQ4_02285 [Alkalicoccobacillus gibsonii]|uniref:hypothetical protein n=1 Tax=Alkalicoccobacillus gibsonii TaxID=79881 RepID=UPI003F7C5B96